MKKFLFSLFLFLPLITFGQRDEGPLNNSFFVNTEVSDAKLLSFDSQHISSENYQLLTDFTEFGFDTEYTNPPLIKAKPLFTGRTPGVNASIVSAHQNHLNAVNEPIGYSLTQSSKNSFVLLYKGITPNVNSGAITTKKNFRGGQTIAWGYTVKEKIPGYNMREIFVVVGCNEQEGEVTTNGIDHKNCPVIKSVGYILDIKQ